MGSARVVVRWFPAILRSIDEIMAMLAPSTEIAKRMRSVTTRIFPFSPRIIRMILRSMTTCPFEAPCRVR
jgi:hypothetical protein